MLINIGDLGYNHLKIDSTIFVAFVHDSFVVNMKIYNWMYHVYVGIYILISLSSEYELLLLLFML